MWNSIIQRERAVEMEMEKNSKHRTNEQDAKSTKWKKQRKKKELNECESERIRSLVVRSRNQLFYILLFLFLFRSYLPFRFFFPSSHPTTHSLSLAGWLGVSFACQAEYAVARIPILAHSFVHSFARLRFNIENNWNFHWNAKSSIIIMAPASPLRLPPLSSSLWSFAD